MDKKSIEAAIDAGLDVWQCGKSIDDGIRAAIAAYRDAEIERLTTLCATLQQQAEIHAMEARGANASLAECYRAVTRGTGEPGNWHGAKPVVNEIADLRAKLEAAERDARRECLWVDDDDCGIWEGSCGVAWTFIDAGPAENGMKHCPQCGGHLTLDEAEREGEQ